MVGTIEDPQIWHDSLENWVCEPPKTEHFGLEGSGTSSAGAACRAGQVRLVLHCWNSCGPSSERLAGRAGRFSLGKKGWVTLGDCVFFLFFYLALSDMAWHQRYL